LNTDFYHRKIRVKAISLTTISELYSTETETTIINKPKVNLNRKAS